MQRLKRGGLPLAIGCFTLIPLSAPALALTSGREHPYDFPLWLLAVFGLIVPLHLWFLWYLMVLVGIFLILARPESILAPVANFLARRELSIDWSRLGIEYRNPAVWWLVIPLSVVAALLMQGPVFGADALPFTLPQPATFVCYACFFFFGAFLYRQGIPVRRWWVVALLPAAVFFCIGFLLLRQYALSTTPSSTASCPKRFGCSVAGSWR